jgi:hypothetical protein
LNNSGIRTKLDCNIERSTKSEQNALVSSIWYWECYGKDGDLKWKDSNHNRCVDEGLNALLDVMFHGTSQITTWYIAIFEDDYTPIAGNTYATPGYTESTAYDEATRPEFVEAAASGKSMTNSANKASFTMNATKTIYGGALVGGGTGASTKGDTAGGGTLYCSSKFSTSKPVESGDTLKVTVTLTASDV